MALEERIQLFPHPPPQLVLELEDRTGYFGGDDLLAILHQLKKEHAGSIALIVPGKYTPDKKHKVYITGSEVPEIRRSRTYLEEQYRGSEIRFLPIPDLEVDEYYS